MKDSNLLLMFRTVALNFVVFFLSLFMVFAVVGFWFSVFAFLGEKDENGW